MSTYPLILFPTFPREAYFACSFTPLWNLLFFPMEFTLSSSCFGFNLPLPRQGAGLPHIDIFHLTVWTDGSVPLPYSKDRSGVIANCSLCGTKATSLFFYSSLTLVTLSSSPSFLLLKYLWQAQPSFSFCTIKRQ